MEPEESTTFVGDQESHSLLTKYLIEGITTGKADLDGSGKMTVDEWYTYLQRQMTDRGLSEPLRWNEGMAGAWVVSRISETLFEPQVNIDSKVVVKDKTIKTLFTIVSLFLLLESLNALSAVQNWEATVPALIKRGAKGPICRQARRQCQPTNPCHGQDQPGLTRENPAEKPKQRCPANKPPCDPLRSRRQHSRHQDGSHRHPRSHLVWGNKAGQRDHQDHDHRGREGHRG